MSKRAYITVATENYHYLALALGRSINLFSKYPLHVFCINYLPAEENKGYGCFFHKIDYEIWETDWAVDYNESGNYYVNRSNPRSFQIMTRKYEACLKILDYDYDECCFIDCDSIAMPNIDSIFGYASEIKNVPLFSLGPHNFMMVTDGVNIVRGNPFEGTWPIADIKKTLEWPLMQFLQVGEEKRGIYRTCNLFIFNKKCRKFIEDAEAFLDSLWRVVDVFYYAPFQDETVMNVLLWKTDAYGLPMVYINLEGFHTLEHFCETEVQNDELFGMFYRLPAEKNLVKVLHGEKRPEELEKITDFLIKLKEKKYFSHD
jgi:hypothetical protein